MFEIYKKKYLLSAAFFICIAGALSAQFTIDPGMNQSICPGDSAVLGGSPTASGGMPPFTYLWTPASGLSNPTLPNPKASPTDNTTYTLKVTDDTGAVKTNAVNITLSYIIHVNAGSPISFCLKGSGSIGGPGNVNGLGVTYLWTPSKGLNDTTLPQPTANPIITTVYTLNAAIAGCPTKIDSVVVTVIQPPPINAGNDITIKEGQTITLHASGGYFYEWTPVDNTMRYDKTANPDVEPVTTHTYFLYGTDAAKRCDNRDTITVFVQPSSDVVFYNTFSPNGDGNNDKWYIGNILKYPNNNLEIYNRNGKLVYKVSGYANTWNGRSTFGEQLSLATYFYIMDLGDNAGVFHGTVTLIK